MADLAEKIEDTMYMWFIFPIVWEAFMGVSYTILPNYPSAIWIIIGMWAIRIILWVGGAISVLKWISKIHDAVRG